MNELANRFLLVGDKFMPEMHLIQPGFTYSACGPFTKNKERIEKFMQTGNKNCIYKNELDKAFFQHDMTYGKTKDLVKGTQSDKVLKDKAFKIASNPKYDGYQGGLASMVYKFFDKTSSGIGIINGSNCQPANDFHKPIFRKCKKRKLYSSFRDNIWGVDLADMQSLSKYNKGNKYLLCAINLFSNYVWVIPIKYKKGTSIVNAFKKIISEGGKPNKIRVDEGSKFYNNSFEEFLKINNIEIYSTYNEGKSVVAERFTRTLKNKIFKAISKNVYFDVLDDIADKYNTAHKTIKMKPIDVTEIVMLNTMKIHIKKNLNLKLVTMLEFQNIKLFLRTDILQNGQKVFVISKIKNTVPWTYVISNLNGEEITESFYEKELQKTNQEKFRIEQVLKRKGDKLYVKWKGYNNRFNSWIDKKDLD